MRSRVYRARLPAGDGIYRSGSGVGASVRHQDFRDAVHMAVLPVFVIRARYPLIKGSYRRTAVHHKIIFFG
ncbi:hypothetical protein D3C74_438530 [compost metagenome]